ncbi:MAG: hypothetical protein HY719_06535 [Planctomycetes bacterium]|nr:hypothetical protein [Planctomycetota bacterium]
MSDLARVLLLLSFLPVAVAIARRDWLSGRIPNRAVLAGLAVAACWQAVFLAATFLPPLRAVIGTAEATPAAYIQRLALEATGALAVGFALYVLRLWAAGDAKLYIVLALLPPVGAAGSLTLADTSCFLVLAYGVILSFLLVFGEFAWRLLSRAGRLAARLRDAVGGPERWRIIGRRLFGVVAALAGFLLTFVVIKAIRQEAQGAAARLVVLEPLVIYLVLWVACLPLIRLFQRRWVFALTTTALAVVAGGALALGWPVNLAEWLRVGAVGGAVILFRLLYRVVQTELETTPLTAAALAPGMLLSPETVRALEAEESYTTTRDQHKSFHDHIGPLWGKRLREDDVINLRRWFAATNKLVEVSVLRVLPMSPALLAGGALAVLFGARPLDALRSLG